MKVIKYLSALLFLLTMYTVPTEAATSKVMWGKDELKPGQIGRITILKETTLYKVDGNVPPGEITPGTPLHFKEIRILKPGEVYRVYHTKTVPGYVPLYGVGGGLFVQQNPSVNLKHLIYETPSKAKWMVVNKK